MVVFHRATTKWDERSFIGNRFDTKNHGPIKKDVIKVIDPVNLKVLDSWGAGMFYMPHGITIDSKGNTWLSDVALHQVFKYEPDQKKPSITLGTRFESGSDENHFCKPTSIAVSTKDEHVFVADGYCNSRVVEFDKDGKYVQSFEDLKSPMSVVHSVVLIEKLNLVCATSREDGRIICFDRDTKEKKAEITNPMMKTVYALKYDPTYEFILAVTGANDDQPSVGLTFNASSLERLGDLVNVWDSNEAVLSDSHDLAVSRDGKNVYVGQLNGEIDQFLVE